MLVRSKYQQIGVPTRVSVARQVLEYKTGLNTRQDLQVDEKSSVTQRPLLRGLLAPEMKIVGGATC